MKRCNECKMNINTERLTCPLCASTLVNIEDNGCNGDCELYPKHKIKKGKSNLFYKIVVFLCIISSLLTFVINISTFNKEDPIPWWSLFVILSAGYIYFLVRGAILTHSYVVKRLFHQLLAISIVMWGYDYLSGDRHWALGIVIPLMCVATNITIGIITMVNRKNYGEGFTSMLLSLLVGIIPFIIILINPQLSEETWPSLVSSCTSLGIFLGMIIFASQATKEEFNKRFHL